ICTQIATLSPARHRSCGCGRRRLRPNRATLLDVLPDHLGLNGTKITGLQISFLGSGHNLFRKRSKEKNRCMNRKWYELDRQSDTELFLLADVEGLASPARMYALVIFLQCNGEL